MPLVNLVKHEFDDLHESEIGGDRTGQVKEEDARWADKSKPGGDRAKGQRDSERDNAEGQAAEEHVGSAS